ncbi:MAG: OPT family oligopeptide transporter [Kofleriaceae bacterium]
MDEATWTREVLQRGVPQLTVRALVTGLGLGFVLSFANVYIGLSTGWFFSMALAACLASFGLWRVLAALRIARSPLSILETSCMQSTASSAAYATGNMAVGVIPALLLMGTQPSSFALAAWIACIAALGVTLAIPLKRQLVNRERLAFPSGTAAAIMLHGLHRGGTAITANLRVLAAALGLGALLPILRGLSVIGASSRVFDWLPRWSAGGATYAVSDAGLVVDHSLLLVGAGVFVGLRTTTWMLAGGLATAFVLGPLGLDTGATTLPGTTWAELGTWLGAPLLVAYGVVALAVRWRSFARTFAWRAAPQDPETAAIEIPMRWFAIGFAGIGACAVVLGNLMFEIPIVLGILAVLASLVLGAVACRITGETDITPGGPMGKLTQLAFGALHPQHPTTNLMTAAMTHASSVAAADLLTDLKAGYLLGAHPRRQFVAQAVGIVAGTIGSVLAYNLLVPDASVLVGTATEPARFAAPGAHQFRAIAELMQHGLASLHPLKQALVVIGAIAGLVLAIAERAAPERARRWMPSPAGLGLGVLLPVSTSLAMLIGAATAAAITRRSPDAAPRIVWPAAAGLLAGESLAAVLVILVNTLVG